MELEPNDAGTHYNLALALKYKGDARQAVDEFEATLSLKPKWADAHYGLGATWFDLHDQPAALKELRRLSDHFKSGQRLSLQNRPTGLAVRD